MRPECPILVMEDDENEAWLLKRAIAKNRIPNPIHVMPDGAEGVAYLAGEGKYSDRTTYPLPCFIITDLHMPRMTWLEVLQWLAKHPEFRIVPVLVLTSSKRQADIVNAYGVGASSYLV